MTRNAIILALVCALAGALYHVWNSSKSDECQLEKPRISDNQKKGTVFYILRELPAGSPVYEADIELRNIPESDVPQSAAYNVMAVVGRRAKFALHKGQILHFSDLDPDPMKTVAKAARTILKGTVISPPMVQETVRTPSECHELPPVLVLGEQVNKDIQSGDTFTDFDIVGRVPK